MAALHHPRPAPAAPVALWGQDPAPALQLVGTGRKAPTYRHRTEIELAVAEMRALRDRGQLCAGTRAPIAARLHVTDRTLRNWLRDADRTDPAHAGDAAGQVGRRRVVLSDDDIAARARFASDSEWYLWWLAKAMATNQAASTTNGEHTEVIPEVHRTTVIRALHRQTDAAYLAGLRGGEKAVAAASARFAVDHQLGDTWQGDLTWLPVKVRLRAGGREFRPVWLAFREPTSGRVMAEALLPQRPDAAMVAAVIGQGLRVTALADGTPLLPPRTVRLDNAGEHLSTELSTLLAGVGITVTPNTDSYASWQNGAIERFWGMAKNEALTHIPGSRILGLTRTGDEYTLPDGAAVAFDDLADELTHRFVPYFNGQRHADSIDGRVPDQVWTEEVHDIDTTGVRRPSAELVARLALLPDDPARAVLTVHNSGVKVGPLRLINDKLTTQVGRQVLVRRWPNKALRAVEVFDRSGRDYYGTAVTHDQFAEEARSRVHCAERHTRDRVKSLKHKALHRFADEFDLLTGPVGGTRAVAAAGTSDWLSSDATTESVADAAPAATAATAAPKSTPAPAAAAGTATTPAGGPMPDWLFDSDGEETA